MAAAIDERIQSDTKGAKSLRDAFRFLVAWSARERRAFTIAELPGSDSAGHWVQTRAIVEGGCARSPTLRATSPLGAG